MDYRASDEQKGNEMLKRYKRGRRVLTMDEIKQEILAYGGDARIYFIQSDTDPYVKIGKASGKGGVRARRLSLQAGNPKPLQLLAVANHVPVRLEAELHAYFSESNLHSEWFTLTDELKELIDFVINNPKRFIE